MAYKQGNSIYSGYFLTEDEYKKKQEELELALQEEATFIDDISKSQEQILNQTDSQGNPKMLTNQDAAAILRLESYKTNPEVYNDYDDDELVQKAISENHPLSDRMLGEPTFGDIASDAFFRIKKSFLYDYQIGANNAVDAFSNRFIGTGGTPATGILSSGYVPFDKKINEYKSLPLVKSPGNINSDRYLADHYTENLTSLNQEEKQQFDLLTEQFYRDEFAERYSMINGERPSEDLISFEWASIKQHAESIDLWRDKKMKEATEYEAKYLLENPQAMAVREWERDAGPFSDGVMGFLKYATNSLGNSLQSQLLTEGFGFIGGLIGTIFSPGAGTGIGYITASSLAGGTLNGGEYSISEIERLTKPMEITAEGAQRLFEQERNEYIQNKDGIKDIIRKQFGRPVPTSEYMDMWNKSNIFEKDGRFIKIGLSPVEAADVTELNTLAYIGVAGATENLSLVGGKLLKTAFPGFEKFIYNVGEATGLNILRRAQDKLEARARKMVGTGIGNRTRRWLTVNSLPIAGRSFMEGLEEVAQGYEQAAIAAHGPIGLGHYKREFYSPSFNEVHGGLKQVRDEFFGGFLGSMFGIVQPITNRLTGSVLSKQNKQIIELSKDKSGVFYAFEWNKDTRSYDLINIVSDEVKDSEGNITIERTVSKLNKEDVLNPETGEQIPVSYNSRGDAAHMANLFNLSTQEANNKIQAYNLRDVKDGEARAEKNEAGEWVVNIYDNNGDIFEKGKDTFKKKGAAQRVAKENNDFLFKVKRTFDKFGGLEGLENDDAIKLHKDFSNLNEGEVKNTPSNVQSDFQKLNKLKIGIRAFVLEDLSNESEEIVKIKEDAERAGIDEDSSIIIDSINMILTSQDENLKNFVRKREEKIFKRFDMAFDEDADYKQKRKILEDIFINDAKRTNTKPTTTRLEKEVDTKDTPTAVPKPTGVIEDTPASIIPETGPTPELETGPPIETGPTQEAPTEQIDTGAQKPQGAPTGRAKTAQEMSDKELDSAIEKQKIAINVSTGFNKTIAEKTLELYEREKLDRTKKDEPSEVKEKVTVGAITMSRDEAEKELADIKASPEYKRAEAKLFDNLTDAEEQQAVYMAELYEDALGYTAFEKLYSEEMSKDKPLDSEWGPYVLVNVRDRNIEELAEIYQGKGSGKGESREIYIKARKEGFIDDYLHSKVLKAIDDKKKKKVDIAPTKQEIEQVRKDKFEQNTKDIFNRLISNVKLKKGKFKLEFIDNPEEDSGYIQGKTIVVNKAKVDIGTVLHELSHPIVSMLRMSDPKLFKKIYDEVINSEKLDIDRIRLEYADETEIDIQEEIVVRAIEEAGKRNIYRYNSKNKLVQAVQNFFNWLFEKLGLKTKVNIFGSEAEMLSPNTSLRDLVNIITNFENRYEINLDENIFETINEISNDNLPVNNSPEEIIENVTNSIMYSEEKNMENMLTSIISRKKEIDIISLTEKWTKSIEKTYKITRRKFGGKWHLQNQEAILKAKSEINNKLRNAIGNYSLINVDTKKFQDKLFDAATAMVALNQKVEFIYKPVDILLSNPDALYNIDDMLKMPGIRKNEQENIKSFVNQFKKENPKTKSMKRSVLAELYLNYSNAQSGLSYVGTTAFSEYLQDGISLASGVSKDFLAYGVAENNSVYRMVAHMNNSWTGGIMHGFPELDNGTGVGWYAVSPTRDGGKLLFEFQSDVLMEFIKIIKNVNNLRDVVLTKDDIKLMPPVEQIIEKGLDKETIDVPTWLNSPNKPLILLNPNILNISAGKYANRPAFSVEDKLKKELEMNGLMNLLHALGKDMSMASPEQKGRISVVNLANERTVYDIKINAGLGRSIINTEVADKILKDIYFEAQKRLNPHNLEGYVPTTNQILDKMFEIISNDFLDDKYFFVETGYNIVPADILDENSEFSIRLNSLKNQQYNEFPDLRIAKQISNVLFSYGEDSPYTKQDRRDLYEFWEWWQQDDYGYDGYLQFPKGALMDKGRNIRNPENSFYKYLLKLHNEQSDYDANKFGAYNSTTSIRRAFEYIEDMILMDEGQFRLSDLISRNGNRKFKLSKTGKLQWAELKKWNFIKNKYRNYKRNYETHKTTIQKMEWVKNILEEEVTTDKTFDLLLKNITKHYIHKQLKMGISLLTAYDIVQKQAVESLSPEGKDFQINFKDEIDSSLEIKRMQEVVSLSKNWFNINILHSIRHAYLTNPNKPIYLNTGEVITLIEGNPAAKSVYNTQEEAQWDNIDRFISNIPADDFILEVEKKLGSFTANNMLVVDYNNVFQKLAPYGKKIGDLSLKESYRIYKDFFDFMINDSKYSDIFKALSKNKIKFDKDTPAYIKEGEFEYITKYKIKGDKFSTKEDFTLEKSDDYKMLEEQMKEAGFDLKIIPISKGIFTKELEKTSKKYNLNLRLAFPDWAQYPLWTVDVKDPDKLLPYRYKKVLKNNINNKTNPQNQTQIKTKIKRKIDIENLNKPILGLYDTKIAEDMFETAWKEVNNLRKTNYINFISKVTEMADIFEYRDMMLDALSGLDPVQDSFEKWFNKKFADKKNDKKYVRKLDNKSKYHWINTDDMNEVVIDIVDELDEGLANISEQAGTKERDVSKADLQTIRELNITLKKSDIKKITASVKVGDYPDYNSWKNFVMPNFFKRSAKFLTKRQDNALHKYYNRVMYSLKTNGNIELINGKPVAALNQRDNYVVKKHQEFNDETNTLETTKIEVELKGPINVVTGNQNNQYEKQTLYESIMGNKNISFISGGDVLGLVNQFDENGNQIYTINPQTGNEVKFKDWGKSYTFFNTKELEMLEKEVNRLGLTIGFIRGDSKKLGLFNYTDNLEFQKEYGDSILNIASNKEKLNNFWNNELRKDDSNAEDIEIKKQFIKEHLNQPIADIAKDIAVYYEMNKIFPNYLANPKGASNLFKRIKIPFTPITGSKEMPNFKIAKFDPNNVEFQYIDGKKFNPVRSGSGITNKYIGDGGSLTSKDLFKKVEDSFGLAPNQAKLKTVIYANDKSGSMLAIKHNHILPKKGFKVIDKKTKKVLWIVDENRNIQAINTDNEGSEYRTYVDMLSTEDEIKMETNKAFSSGFIDDSFGLPSNMGITIPGESLGVIKFAESHKKTIKHIMQWYNYVYDENVINHFVNVMVPEVEKKLSRAFYLSFSSKMDDKGRFVPNTKSGVAAQNSIAQFFDKLKGKNIEGFDDIALELAKLGAGLHPSLQIKVDKLVQTQIVDTIINMGDSPGSIYDLSPDFTGSLKSSLSPDSNTSEVSLAVQNSQMVIDRLHDLEGIPRQNSAGGKKLSVSRLNELLEKHEINVMITRSPVVHKGGAFMARVKNLHERSHLAELNWRDVFVKLEGDYDGDEVHIELLSPETEAVYKPYLDSLKVKGVDLNKFASGIVKNPLTQKSRFETMNNLMAGQNAISEVSNVALIYGIVSQVYNGFNIKNTNIKIRVRQPDEIIKFPEATYLGKKGSWSGTVDEYLRIWLQAAADNNEFSLLEEWNYSKNGLLKSLLDINIQNETAKNMHLDAIVAHLNLFIKVNNVRKGYDSFKKYGLRDMIKNSKELQIIMGLDDNTNLEAGNIYREALILDNQYEVDIKNSSLTALESLAILPYKIWNKLEKNWNYFGYEGSPYYISNDVHKNAHIESVEYINRLGLEIFESKVEKDKKLGNFKGTTDTWAKSQNEEGRVYAHNMSKEYLSLLKNITVKGSDIMNFNTELINWIEKHDPKFKALSETAKSAATLYFLRGLMSLQNNSVTGKNRYPISIPPVSVNSKNVNLLDASIMKAYFKEYNDIVNNESRIKVDKVREMKGGQAIEILIRDACKGV